MKKIIIVIAVVILISTIAIYTKPPIKQAPIAAAETRRHMDLGSVEGFVDQHGAHAWLGIPYAQSPVDDLRWRAPRPVNAWQDSRQSLAFSPDCAQIGGPSLYIPKEQFGQPVGSEDCLYLNIWAPPFTPDKIPKGNQQLPVMVWIHGGGNTVGASSTYVGHHLAVDQQVIVVSINYRLGVLGWFSHPALHGKAASAEDRSGNYATLDMIESLKWVRDHISAFGGDPDNVTIFGESAGGRNVFSLLASPLAKGLFHRAISQSGSLRTDPLSWAENGTDDEVKGSPYSSRSLIKKLLIADQQVKPVENEDVKQVSMKDAEINRYLREKPFNELLAVIGEAGAGMYPAPQLLRDGVVIPKTPLLDVFKAQKHHRVPIMLGSNRDEFKLMLLLSPGYVRWLGPLPRVKDLDYYNRVSAYFSDHWKAMAVDEPASILANNSGESVYAYRFDWDEEPHNWIVKLDDVMGASHGFEINFVFGDFDHGLRIPGIYSDENLAARLQLSEEMMNYWGHFARYGKPGRGSHGQSIEWPAWQNAGQKFMLFDTTTDGGLRMSDQEVTPGHVKRRLDEDAELPQKVRCSFYVEMFYTSFQEAHHWDEQEYNTLGPEGCEAYPPIDFM